MIQYGLRQCVRYGGFVASLMVWWAVLHWNSGKAVTCLVVAGGVLLIFPIALVGRRILQAHPTCEFAERSASVIHYLIMIPVGAAIFKAIQTVQRAPGSALPIPPQVGLTLMVISGFLALMTVGNLALKGLGAPFAIALSRRLASSWLYSRTRNPMILTFLLFLISTGLWQGSIWFLAWVFCLVAPALLFMVKIYEERELELRFGEAYRDYRAKTPFLVPWKRKRKQVGS